jgi:hypothetical protein
MRWAEWRFSARLAWQDPFIRWTTIVTALFIVGMGAFILWRLIPEGVRASVLTLHYNVYLGIDEVRPWQWIFVLPGGMAAILVVNTVFSFGFYRNHALAARAVCALAAMMALLWGIGSFFLILVNL